MNPSECPLYPEMQNIKNQSHTLARSIKRLRNRLSLCLTCECNGECTILAQFNADVQTAIQEVSDEWNLAQVVQ